MDALDLPGRMAFANEVKQSVVPFVNSLPTSGGVYIDQQQNGSLVVLQTESSAALEAEIRADARLQPWLPRRQGHAHGSATA